MQVDRSFWEGQRPDPRRYALVPRTLTFIRRGEHVLLIQLSRGAWAGRFNGIGGHVERAEDPQSAALRELHEETGMVVSALRLCGVVAIDAEPALGIGLYIFVGEASQGEPGPRAEGTPTWVTPDEIHSLPLVDDLGFLLDRAMAAYRDGIAFSAAYRVVPEGGLEIVIGG